MKLTKPRWLTDGAASQLISVLYAPERSDAGRPGMKRPRLVFEVIAAVTAGWCALVLPVILDPPARYYETGFLPFMRDAVESGRPYSLALLFGVGVALGILGTASPWVLGFAAVLTLPAWSATDLILQGGHNLLPAEWFIYGMYGFIGCAGALSGRRFMARRQRSPRAGRGV
jgi:hypothetical protein